VHIIFFNPVTAIVNTISASQVAES
jgi:hypothetical protein